MSVEFFFFFEKLRLNFISVFCLSDFSHSAQNENSRNMVNARTELGQLDWFWCLEKSYNAFSIVSKVRSAGSDASPACTAISLIRVSQTQLLYRPRLEKIELIDFYIFFPRRHCGLSYLTSSRVFWQSPHCEDSIVCYFVFKGRLLSAIRQ